MRSRTAFLPLAVRSGAAVDASGRRTALVHVADERRALPVRERR